MVQFEIVPLLFSEKFERKRSGCYNLRRSTRFPLASVVRPAKIGLKEESSQAAQQRHWKRGQVAQVVERSPEKAGVGGSTPSLATTFSIT